MSAVRPTPIQPKVIRVKRVRRRLKPVSEKRRKENAIYEGIKKWWLKQHPYCETVACMNPTVDVHHKAGRNGWRLCDVTNWMAVCRKHHDMIHGDPAWAAGCGYSLPRVPTPEHLRPTPPKDGLIQKDL